MKPYLLIANWKMNGRLSQLQAWLSGFQQRLGTLEEEGGATVEQVLCLPSPYLGFFKRFIESSAARFLQLGAQDLSQYPDDGAFTGEYSASMVADVGCKWVIIGHSERRRLFGDTDACCANKFRHGLQAGLKPIICVGETQVERAAGQAWARVEAQLSAVFSDHQRAEDFAIAYEPVWAIGTGQTATPEEAQGMHQQVRQYCEHHLGVSPPILYGGSVNPTNAASLFAQPDIAGGLIGGASLKVESFLDMVSQLNRAKCS